MRFRLPRLWKMKAKEAVEAKKPELEEKPKKEFPGISTGEQRKYVGKHVAIVDGKIVAGAKNVGQLLLKVKKKYPKEKTILRYVADDKLLLKCKCFRR